MKCPYCKAETFMHKPHLSPNTKSRDRYKLAEADQFLKHIKKHRGLLKGKV